MLLASILTFTDINYVNAQTATVPKENFIEDILFTETLYYEILEAFFEGMGWPALYENADSCRLAISDFFDDFHKLKNNQTATES